MNHKPSPLPDDLPAILREELERTPIFTPEMEAELAAANRELEADPLHQAEVLKMVFVNEMLAALEHRGETKSQLAERLGKTRQYVQKVFNEDRRVNFTIETLCTFAHALGRRVHMHVCKEDEEPMIVTCRKTSAVTMVLTHAKTAAATPASTDFKPSGQFHLTNPRNNESAATAA